MSRRKKPKPLSPAAEARLAMLTARREGRPWDAVYNGALAFHYDLQWQTENHAAAIKCADQMRAILNDFDYQAEVDWQNEHYAQYVGADGVRLQIGRDLDALALPAQKEKALIQAIVAWSAAGADPAQLQEIVAAYRTEEGDKEVSP